MKKVLTITLTTLLIFCAVQISLMALNNDGTSETPFNSGRYSGVVRQARDVDGPLGSSAYTGVYARQPDPNQMDELLYNWSASASVGYTGNNPSYRGNYDLKAKILSYQTVRSGNFAGSLSQYTGFYVEMSPPPDGVTLDINDCESHGDADGVNQTNDNTHHTRSEIPF